MHSKNCVPGGKIVRQKGKIVFTKWHDKRDVLVLSSNPSPDVPDVIQRHNQQVHKPAVIALYNKLTGVLISVINFVSIIQQAVLVRSDER